ncbi:hypothetical protein XENORESO_007264 [Xenotaenia resolanae]|uniref:Uncharacterized protein n=1 Tax=Xenotaenia resolanae TaxID=208358 RepID=A0ABV0W910_9TELE
MGSVKYVNVSCCVCGCECLYVYASGWESVIVSVCTCFIVRFGFVLLPCLLLGLSSALLWGSCGGPLRVPCSGGPLSVAQISSVSVSGPGAQVHGSSHSLLYIFMEKPYLHKHA